MTFDPTIALLNHSCNPNAAIVFDRNVASVRSIRDISAGEQVTISYVDNTHKRAIRRKELREKYFFDCRCEGCEPPDNKFGERDCWVCEKTDCRGLIPEPMLNDNFICPTCHSTQSVSLSDLRNLENKAVSVFLVTSSVSGSRRDIPPQLNRATHLNEIVLPTLASLTTCPSWHPLRQPAPSLRREVYHLALDTRNFEAAYHHSNTLSTPPLLNIHPEPFHPLKTVAVLTTSSLIALLGAEQNSVDYCLRAWELLKVCWELCKGSHGEGSQFARWVAAKRGEVETFLSMGGEDVRRRMRLQGS
jgi:SET domain